MMELKIYPEPLTDDHLYYSEESEDSWRLFRRNFIDMPETSLEELKLDPIMNQFISKRWGLEGHPYQILSSSKKGYYPNEVENKFIVDSLNEKALKECTLQK